MATVTVTPTHLEISLTRGERVGGFLGDRRFPRAAVTGVEIEPDGVRAVKGWRSPGLGLPSRRIGTWRRHGRKELVSVRRGQPALRIALSGQDFDSVLVGIDDAEATARELAST